MGIPMLNKSICIFSVIGMLASAIINAREPEAVVKNADLVMHNARVYTVNSAQPWASAIVIASEKIVYVGTDAGAKQWIGPSTRVQDLDGRLVLPGFQDAHVHPLEGASLETFMGCDLYDISNEDPNPENWIELIKPCVEDIDLHGWVLGGGHSNLQLLKLDRPPRELLDEAFPDTPAAFMEKSSHSMWVNSKALEVVGITADTPHPQGGRIFHDPSTGEPNGILSDSAGDELMHIALSKTPQLQEARYQALLISQDLLVRHGITSANNARVYWKRGNLEPWLRAEQEGTLKTRTVLSLWAYPHMDDDSQLAYLKTLYADSPESMLRLSQIKFYMDGVPDLNSAAVLQPYGYLIFPEASPIGLNYFTQQRLSRYITELERVGFGVVIHAIGDRGAREALNAIEEAQRQNPQLGGTRRHYISHVGWLSPQDIPRFAQLNVTADTQINFEPESIDVSTDGVERDVWDALYANTESDMDALPELFESGARIVLSSDWDVASIDPLYSLYRAAVVFSSAMKPEDVLPFAIRAYTLNAAYAMNQDGLTGSVEIGKFADLIVLDENIFELPAERIKDARVMMTLVGGREVYRSSKWKSRGN
ncbi:MAG: putative amidohydrolase YtcJ [Halieaceae bacterium]|jgi:predicted amidohydrolase YtcJ